MVVEFQADVPGGWITGITAVKRLVVVVGRTFFWARGDGRKGQRSRGSPASLAGVANLCLGGRRTDSKVPVQRNQNHVQLYRCCSAFLYYCFAMVLCSDETTKYDSDECILSNGGASNYLINFRDNSIL